MSNSRDDLIPIRTQIVKRETFNWSQYSNITRMPPLMVVYIPGNLSEHQELLMKRCQSLLELNVHHSLVKMIRYPDQVTSLPKEQTNAYFIIPEEENNVIRKIRDCFPKSGKIYLPRAVIGALCHHHTSLPVRSFTVSLSMHDCHVFLSIGYKVPTEEEKKRKERERREIIRRIFELGGSIVTNWKDLQQINVVVTDNASSKHSIIANKNNIPVVSRNWVDDTYEQEKTQEYHENEEHHNALTSVDHYLIRPFYGLHFKIAIRDPLSAKEAKNLIIENQGQVIYGNETCLTHVVRQEKEIKVQQMGSYQSQGKKNLHYVGLNWLRTCAHEGRCIGLKDFKVMTQAIKQERISPDCITPDECFSQSPTTPPLSQSPNNDENYQAMLPPAPPPQRQTSFPRQQQTTYLMSDDMILKSLNSDQQTVHASTQIRRLPDPELQIEQICEPSQQLFWNDARNS